MLGKDYVVNNYGVGGCTMLRKGDCPYWEKQAYKDALASDPDIVFIDLGGNDSKGKKIIVLSLLFIFCNGDIDNIIITACSHFSRFRETVSWFLTTFAKVNKAKAFMEIETKADATSALTKIKKEWETGQNPSFDDLSAYVLHTHRYTQTVAIKAVNQLATMRNWLIGCYIVEYEIQNFTTN